MIRRQQATQAAALFASDLVMTASAYLLAYWLRFGLQIVRVRDNPDDIPGLDIYLPLLLAMFMLLPLVFAATGLYRVRRTNARVETHIRTVGSITLTMILFVAAVSLYRPTTTIILESGVTQDLVRFQFSRLMLAAQYGLTVILVLAGRLGIQLVLDRRRRSGRNLKHILIAGAGPLAHTVIDKIRLHEEFGFRVIGMLEEPGHGAGTYRFVPVVGTLDEVVDAIRHERADQLYVALPLTSHESILKLLHDVGNEMVEIKVVPDLLQYITLGAGVEDLDGVPIVNLSRVPMEGFQSVIKRAIDMIAAAGLLLLFAPLLPLVALAVKCTSRGPVFYGQERMGLDGRPFRLLKFRSMIVDAEAETGPVWTSEEDTRCTPIGAFLRKLSLDELPQFWNILRGDMSLVGPRPERPYFVDEFRNRIPRYMLRHRVRAGLTGWAQVHGWRGNTSLAKRIEYDLYYIENWSLALDLKILWMTVSNGMVHEHAY